MDVKCLEVSFPWRTSCTAESSLSTADKLQPSRDTLWSTWLHPVHLYIILSVHACIQLHQYLSSAQFDQGTICYQPELAYGTNMAGILHGKKTTQSSKKSFVGEIEECWE